MTDWMDEVVGGPVDPVLQRALDLADGDRRFLRELIGCRRDRGLSQQQVADSLGITQPSVAAFERYDADPKLSTLRRYALAVGADITHSVRLDDTWRQVPIEWSQHLRLGSTSQRPLPSALSGTARFGEVTLELCA